MRVLVTGAGGFLGRYVVAGLLQRGHDVRAIIRPTSCDPQWSDAVELFRADLRVHDNLVPAFDGIDAVIHLAAATRGGEDAQFTSSVVGTERFLNAMTQSSVRRLIHVSSLVVYDWTRAVGVMDENTPLLTNASDMGAYTIAKVWQERVVKSCAKAQAWDLTIVRPGFIWGPKHSEIGGMGRHYGRVYLMFGPLTRLPLCYVENCASCIIAAVENPAAIGETFNAIDSDDIRVWRYVREFARRTGRHGLMLPLPYYCGLGLAHSASLISRILFGKKGKLPSLLMPLRFEWQFKPIRFSTRKLREKLGWRPPLSFHESLKRTYETTV
jgi:UDP-glucose 4-epimerase